MEKINNKNSMASMAQTPVENKVKIRQYSLKCNDCFYDFWRAKFVNLKFRMTDKTIRLPTKDFELIGGNEDKHIYVQIEHNNGICASSLLAVIDGCNKNRVFIGQELDQTIFGMVVYFDDEGNCISKVGPSSAYAFTFDRRNGSPFSLSLSRGFVMQNIFLYGKVLIYLWSHRDVRGSKIDGVYFTRDTLTNKRFTINTNYEHNFGYKVGFSIKQKNNHLQHHQQQHQHNNTNTTHKHIVNMSTTATIAHDAVTAPASPIANAGAGIVPATPPVKEPSSVAPDAPVKSAPTQDFMSKFIAVYIYRQLSERRRTRLDGRLSTRTSWMTRLTRSISWPTTSSHLC